MSDTDNYILLPSLKHIKVSDYTLFQKDWEYKVQKGLNLFVGVNGLGKTTTTSLIIYGLVGFTANYDREIFNIDEDYFINRKDANSNDDQALLEVEFYVGKNVFKITRRLFEEEIVSFTYNSKDQDSDNYSEYLVRDTKLGSIEDLAFILEKFLIREEEANYLLWNFKDQSKLLQLLISPIGFKEKYQSMANELSDLTTFINRTKDTNLKSLNKQLEDAKKLKLADKTSSKTEKNRLKKIDSLNLEITELDDKRTKILAGWKDSHTSLTKLRLSIEKVVSEIDGINEQILHIEHQFYRNTYTDKKVMSAIQKLKYYDSCIYCDNTVSGQIKERILAIIQNEKCPVCRTKFGVQDDEVTELQYDIDDLKDLEQKLARLSKKRLKLEESKIKIKLENDQKADELEKLNDKLDDLNIERLKLNIEQKTAESKDDYSIYDIQIKTLRENIDKIKNKLLPKENKAKQLALKLEKENDKLSSVVAENLSLINNSFRSLAAEYFRDDSELQIKQKQLKKTNNFEKIRQSHYVPYYEGKQRTLQKHCSTSERLFLEYLFRLSLMKLYLELRNDKGNSFLIFETSEGAFDVKYTARLAQTFVDFAKTSDAQLILIVNLSKPDFVKNLLEGVSSDEGILNYLDFGRISPAELKPYSETIKMIGLA
ncbi:AAA family ATPase [Altibacter sp. HG106]|uniref:AAA family ATPase n=1 Tax=Altibacter sp. HG106 TaxID=3023937 RepID=UPI002350F5B7|nr:AAA family ATPase [Altibacter sp. HG106]MDC7994041.1 AAA family ATPase [Altibacter sp. HG106]